MGNIKQINIKNRTYHFFNDMINIKGFEPSLIKIDKKSYKNIGIHHIGYITNKSISDCENINSVNPLYLIMDTLKMDHIQTIKAGKSGEYEKDYKKIKFNSDDDLSLNKILKLHMLTITVRSVFEEDGKYYPQVFLDECLYEA